jgi:hypothetical protein
VAGQLADVRLKLRTSMRATQDALHAGVAEDESLKESLALFQRLSAHGHELDAELRRLESDPDRAKLAERLPELRERTERIIKSADSLRWAAHDRARRFAEDDLDALSTQIDLEAGALRHWTTTEPTSSSAAHGPPPAAAPSWPEAPAPEAAASHGQSRPESPPSHPAGEPPRPAINPPGPRTTYPWQKKPRPESTT